MTPQEESLSLREFPLPDAMDFTACKSAEVLPNISYLQDSLDQLKSRAISENLKESGRYVLVEIPGKLMRNPINNIQKFKDRFPDGYALVRREQHDRIASDYQTAMANLEFSGIPLTLADAKIGKDLVTEFVGYQPQKITVEVRVRPEMIK